MGHSFWDTLYSSSSSRSAATRTLGSMKCAMRWWQTVVALKPAFIRSLERDDRAIFDNRVRKTIPLLWRPNGEEILALLTILNSFKNTFTPYTLTQVTETWFPIHLTFSIPFLSRSSKHLPFMSWATFVACFWTPSSFTISPFKRTPSRNRKFNMRSYIPGVKLFPHFNTSICERSLERIKYVVSFAHCLIDLTSAL